MIRRIKQFFTAVSARLTEEDRAYVDRFVAPGLRELFMGMGVPEQRHALNVAYTAQRLAAGRSDICLDRLLQAALLHDVGKRRGDISVADKVMTVLVDSLMPGAARRLAREEEGGGWRHALFIYYHHAGRGAKLLAVCGADPELVEWVRRHHEPPAPEDAPELILLRTADELN